MWRSATRAPRAWRTPTGGRLHRLGGPAGPAHRRRPGRAAGVREPGHPGLRMQEIRTGQLDDALAMGPDLLTVFGGMNDVIAPALRLRRHPGRARDRLRRGAPAGLHRADLHHARPGRDQPAGRPPAGAGGQAERDHPQRGRAVRRAGGGLRGLSGRRGPAAVVRGPVARQHPRPHQGRGRAGLAAGITGFDESWAEPLDGRDRSPRSPRERLTGDVDWACTTSCPGWARACGGCHAAWGSIRNARCRSCCRSRWPLRS